MTHMPVWIAGVGMTEFGVRPDVSVKELTQAAVVGALTDAGVHPTAIEAAYFGNTCQDVLEGQVVVAGQMALRSMGFERIPIVNVENACATGATALHQAIMHVRSGAADIVLAVGAEKLSIGDKTKALGVFDGGVDVNDRQGVRAVLEELGGALPDDGKPHSLFMDVYAALARAHMNAFGTTREQLALIASKNHEHAVHNPLAHFRAEMSVEEILAARPVSGPLTVPMCAPLTDGASAVVVCNAAGLKRLDGSRPIRILAAVLQSGTVRPLSAWDRSVTRLAAQAAYEQAGVGPQDISVAEVHDASSRVIARFLADEGFLRCSVDEAVATGAHALFFPHGVGHHLGLDVHDLENFGDLPSYPSGKKRPDQFGTENLRLDLPLEDDWVVTIEPGIYFVDPILRDPVLRQRFAGVVDFDKALSWLDFGGIRIEDDIRICGTEPEVLTPVAKTVTDIEALVGTGACATTQLCAGHR